MNNFELQQDILKILWDAQIRPVDLATLMFNLPYKKVRENVEDVLEQLLMLKGGGHLEFAVRETNYEVHNIKLTDRALAKISEGHLFAKCWQ